MIVCHRAACEKICIRNVIQRDLVGMNIWHIAAKTSARSEFWLEKAANT